MLHILERLCPWFHGLYTSLASFCNSYSIRHMFVNILFLCTVNSQENADVAPHLGLGRILGLDTESDIKQLKKEIQCQREQLKLPY
jgi:hypothetical protein